MRSFDHDSRFRHSRSAPPQISGPIADELLMTLDELDKLIREARSPHELFGDDIDAALRRFRIVCHPDRNPGDPRAECLFKDLHVLAEQARRPPVILSSPKGRQYTLLKRIAVGEVADVHLASAAGKGYGPQS